ncbi:hypothetical protein [Azorhizobium doebereinerae]|uniref:hypothetical protein n=1 Tax=Azorhizobium doebereinerae TaxID=281091 RepID=UPI000684776C|nr:hypothetical protein [Azorhizobium doebereinerae]
MSHIGIIVELLRRRRIDLTDEKRTQADIEQILVESAIPFEREKRLAPGDIVDFLVAGGLAIEVKTGGSKASIYRQLLRYASHEAVTAMLLVSNVPMTLPPLINGKRAAVASLGAAWI